MQIRSLGMCDLGGSADGRGGLAFPGEVDLDRRRPLARDAERERRYFLPECFGDRGVILRSDILLSPSHDRLRDFEVRLRFGEGIFILSS